MIEPYQAIGLVPTMWGIRHRDEIGHRDRLAGTGSLAERRIVGVDSAVAAYGRPVGVNIAKDGSLLVADDVGGKVWRVTSATPRALPPKVASR